MRSLPSLRNNVLTRGGLLALASLAIVAAGADGASAAKFKLLHSFCTKSGCKDGSGPAGPLVMDSSGNFFGTTVGGGHNGRGTAFELRRSDTGKLKFQTIFSFCKGDVCDPSGSSPRGALIIDVQGNLYGMASTGGGNGKGVVFELTPNGDTWAEKALYTFCSEQNCADGAGPPAGLTYAGAGSGVPYDGTSPLYGTTNTGGANNAGTVFELTQSGGQWTGTVLYSFCSEGKAKCTDGAEPNAGLIMDGAGNLLGTAAHGGGNNYGNNGGGAGVVYQLSPEPGNVWSETVLYRFCSADQCTDGAFPLGGLTIDGVGNLFGSAAAGGLKCAHGCGVLFKLVPNGSESQETVLYAFCARRNCADGAGPHSPPIIDADGSLFGTTENGGGNNIDLFGRGGGVLYKLTGSSYKILHHFCSLPNCADGEYPHGNPIIDASGSLLAATALGGVFGHDDFGGTVFRLQH